MLSFFFKSHKKEVIIRRSFVSPTGETVYIVDKIFLKNPHNNIRCMDIKGMPGHYSCVPLSKNDNTLHIYCYCEHFIPKTAKRCLVLGGAGGTIPRYILKEYESIVDVVEINSFYIELSKKYFLNKFYRDKRIEFFNLDAREYVISCKKRCKYDFIFCDLFERDKVVEFVFDTEFQKNIYALLSENGVLVMNLGSSSSFDVSSIINNVGYIYPFFNNVYNFSNSRIIVSSKKQMVFNTNSCIE